MPGRTKRKSSSRRIMSHYAVAFVFAIGFGVLGLSFLKLSHAANPAVAVSGIGGKCLDNYQSKKVDGNKIDLFTCNSTGAQQWRINGNASTSGTIVNSNGYCLGISGGATANYTKVILYHCDGNTSQQWFYNSANGRITNKLSKTCMDDNHSVTTNGNQIDIFSCNNTSAQIWHYKVTPTITISSPASGAKVSGSSVLFSAKASAPSANISNITLIANGATVRSCSNASSCFVSWNSTTVKNGTYTIQVSAAAQGGNSATKSESVVVSNSSPKPPPPPPPPPSPNPGPSPSPSPSPSPFTGSGSGSTVNLNPTPSPNPGLDNGQPSDNGGTIGFDNGNTTTVDNGAPLVANIQATTITKSTITLSWEGTNANSYEIKYGTDSKKLDNTRTISSTDAVPTYTLTKLPTGKTIYIQITPASDAAYGAAVTANFKTKSPGNAGAVFLWIFLTLIAVIGIIMFLIRRRLNLESSLDDPDIAISENAPVYPREDSEHESERLNWWMPDEQRHQAAHHQAPRKQ
ncbi:MAG TPA: ricin-type beta-trefoil lectin domain protein, partial [Candidatus Saccharimonadales bacterium]|nr:ricin-type beta-trefoil lectin domain protein [Candidatus Saccharimonadales bacterium]